jgi:effector-binding domain-containing protein
VDVEAGFPVAVPVRSDGTVQAGALPAGRVVQADHLGSYDSLRETYEAIERWMGEHGLEPADEMWEVYLSGPETDSDPASWRTHVVWPVR